jgi:hypothetical protein
MRAHGFRVLVFDYRDHADSDTSDDPVRLDRDVAGVIPSGSAGFDTIDFNSYADRVRSAILGFIERIAGR